MTLLYQQQQGKVFISGGEVLQHHINNKESMASLPGDPQANLFAKLHRENVKGLINNGYLRMNLLDFILNSTCTYSSDQVSQIIVLVALSPDNGWSTW